MDSYDVAIVGGGCIGCSSALHLAESDLEVCLVEKEHHIAAHQSGRNSGVLHPGFNYEPGSLKARFATEGTARAKRYAETNGIPLEEFGVLVVAETDDEIERLERLSEQAEANGVETSLLTDRESIREHEPHASGVAALYCPEAASIDSQQFVYSMARDAAARGVDFFMNTRVERIRPADGGHLLETSTGAIRADYVLNAAGLYADEIAAQFGVARDYQIVPFRGEYYELRAERRELVRTMIYPTPDPSLPFLGVHFTRRADNKVIVGPNAVLAFGREAYRNTDVDLREFAQTLRYRGFWKLLGSRKMVGVAWDELNKSYRKARFVDAARRLVPGVRDDDFVDSYAGIRAQLVAPDGSLVKQPRIEYGPDSLHVLNAVSPGLTCSLPFGEHLAEKVRADIDGTR